MSLVGVVNGIVCRVEDLSPGGARISFRGLSVLEPDDRVTLAFDLEGRAFELTAEVRRVDSGGRAGLEFVANPALSVELLSAALRRTP